MIVKSVTYLEAYRLIFEFKDWQKRLIDLEDFFMSCDLPAVRRFAPLERFKTVYADGCTIAWGDNECDINPLSIYWGEFEAADSPYKEQIARAIAGRKD